jgi:hypothetical protein
MRLASIMALGLAAILSLAGIARAQQPTVTDIAICNEEAARVAAPSALPGPGRPPETARPLPNGARGGIPVAQKGERPGAKAVWPGTQGASGEKTDPSGTIVTEARDPLLKGMDAAKLDDPAYRTTYRACTARRTGR